jgi:uncharacterized repeat protein (TIGR03943 family)
MNSIPNIKSKFQKVQNLLLPWLDVLAVIGWGMVMLKHWLTGKLNLLIHPNYFFLVIAGGIGLLLMGGFKAWELLRKRRRIVTPTGGHITLFPPGISSTILLITAIWGLFVTPQVFASDKAVHRGLADMAGITRAHPQAFRSQTSPEDRTLLDWVRTLNVYPEPDTYTGQKAKVQGFVVHPPDLSEQYIFLARFVITCCAADAYPVGLPVKLNENRSAYPPDTWLEVEGQMFTDTLIGKRKLTLAATSLKKIPQPQNPYEY